MEYNQYVDLSDNITSINTSILIKNETDDYENTNSIKLNFHGFINCLHHASTSIQFNLSHEIWSIWLHRHAFINSNLSIHENEIDLEDLQPNFYNISIQGISYKVKWPPWEDKSFIGDMIRSVLTNCGVQEERKSYIQRPYLLVWWQQLLWTFVFL